MFGMRVYSHSLIGQYLQELAYNTNIGTIESSRVLGV
jgi:hypothetical protein